MVGYSSDDPISVLPDFLKKSFFGFQQYPLNYLKLANLIFLEEAIAFSPDTSNLLYKRPITLFENKIVSFHMFASQ